MNYLFWGMLWTALSATIFYLIHELLDHVELLLQGAIVSTGTHKLTVVVSGCAFSALLLTTYQQPVPVPVLAGVIMGTALQIWQPGLFRKV